MHMIPELLAKEYDVADVDHNKLQENVVVTSGLDGVVKFWDLRMNMSSNGSIDAIQSNPSPWLLKTGRRGQFTIHFMISVL